MRILIYKKTERSYFIYIKNLTFAISPYKTLLNLENRRNL
jgi:hypothetical protein